MSEETKKVSVVLCSYNGSLYIEKQLDSILKQTYPIDEIIIVDDCSKDSTREILEEYQKRNNIIKLFFNEKNLGSNKSFKNAISLASNDYIVLSDQDDIWFTNKIEKQIKAIKSDNTKPLLVFHDLSLIDENGKTVFPSFWKLHGFFAESFNFKKLFVFNIVTGCTCLINKAMKDELMLCNMENIIMHDYLIALIAYGFGEPIFINEQLMYYRTHSNSVTIKEKNTFFDRVKGLVSRVRNRNYLLPNILQIQKYYELYDDNLSDEKKKLVIKFLKLKNKSTLQRFIYKRLMN